MRPLWALGLSGTNRSTQHCDYATVYYNKCYLLSNGWGTFGVDGGRIVRLYAKDCTIESKGPRSRGYGAFSIGDCLISYDHCTLNVQGYPLLMGGGEGICNGEIIGGSVINSTLYGVMIFRDKGSELKVKDATFNTASSVFVVKGSHSYLNIDKATLNPANGVILQLMDNDEPGMGPSRFVVPTGVDTPIPGRDMTKADPNEDVFMTVSNTEATGDFYNSTTNLKANCREKIEMERPEGLPADLPEGFERNPEARQGVKNLDLKFVNAKINGVISSAIAAYKEGVLVIDASNCKESSAVTQTAYEPINNGVIVSLDKDSVWTVAGTSYLTSLKINQGATVKAPKGKTLTMTVNGAKKKIAPGTYMGRIVLKIA